MDTYVHYCPKCKTNTNWKWPDQLCMACGHIEKEYRVVFSMRCDNCKKFGKHVFLGADAYCGNCFPMVMDFYEGWKTLFHEDSPTKLPFDLTLIRSPR